MKAQTRFAETTVQREDIDKVIDAAVKKIPVIGVIIAVAAMMAVTAMVVPDGYFMVFTGAGAMAATSAVPFAVMKIVEKVI